MMETDSGIGAIPPEQERLRRLVAEQCRFALGVRMPANWEVAVKNFDYGHRIGVAFSMWLLGCEIRRDTENTESVPVTWWDHLKDRFGLLRWVFGPPRLRQIPTEIKHWHVCPHLAAPRQDKHVIFLAGESLPLR